MKKLIKLNSKEEKYDTRLLDQLTGCPSSSSTMVSKDVKLIKLLSWYHKGKELLIIQIYIDDIIIDANFEVLLLEFCPDFLTLNENAWTFPKSKIYFSTYLVYSFLRGNVWIYLNWGSLF